MTIPLLKETYDLIYIFTNEVLEVIFFVLIKTSFCFFFPSVTKGSDSMTRRGAQFVSFVS